MVKISSYPASKANYGGTRALSTIKYIVIHYTANDGDTAISNAKYFANEVPARSCVEVANLPKAALVEIEAIAVEK